MYLQAQRESERFWMAMHRDLRASGSVYGLALDGLLARRGAVRKSEFAVISGATVVPIRRQVTVETVLRRLVEARLVREVDWGEEPAVVLEQPALGIARYDGIKAREAVERIILDALREWARNIGAAGYNSIAIRGEENLKPVQQFQFDFVGPSYLLPLQRGEKRGTGFLVADVFSDGPLDEFQIQYFLRKARALHASLKGTTILPLLVADEFTPAALTAGHAAGILMATPRALFGKRVGDSLRSLLTTLNNVAAYASADSPERLIGLVNSLQDIEGRSHNLRGPLFELLAAYLARRDAVSIDVGISVRHPQSGEKADIDVRKILDQARRMVAIECKAREPGGTVGIEEVERWLKKVPVIQQGLRQGRDVEAEITCEIWTTGEFTADAAARLAAEKAARTRNPINFKTGKDVVALATELRERAVGNILREHFVRHPLAAVPASVATTPSDLTAGLL